MRSCYNNGTAWIEREERLRLPKIVIFRGRKSKKFRFFSLPPTMILQLTYATATDLISSTEKLVALQRARRSRVSQIQTEFNDIAYDIFVIRGIPFTEVVQFLQEFGSSVEMEKLAHALFTSNMKTDTECPFRKKRQQEPPAQRQRTDRGFSPSLKLPPFFHSRRAIFAMS